MTSWGSFYRVVWWMRGTVVQYSEKGIWSDVFSKVTVYVVFSIVWDGSFYWFGVVSWNASRLCIAVSCPWLWCMFGVCVGCWDAERTGSPTATAGDRSSWQREDDGGKLWSGYPQLSVSSLLCAIQYCMETLWKCVEQRVCSVMSLAADEQVWNVSKA